MGNNIHVYQSDITTESRVQRHCQALDESGLFDRIIYLGCTTGYERTEDFSGNCTARMLPRRNTVGRGLLFKLKATRAWGKRVFDAAVSLGADCVTCHSLPALAVCCRVKERLNCRLVYEPLTQVPDKLYGASQTGSNYQGQGLKLSKHFRTLII